MCLQHTIIVFVTGDKTATMKGRYHSWIKYWLLSSLFWLQHICSGGFSRHSEIKIQGLNVDPVPQAAARALFRVSHVLMNTYKVRRLIKNNDKEIILCVF
jgi:hypothetical protein